MKDTQADPGPDLDEISLAELPQRLRDACARAGWSELMPVQRQAIPYIFEQQDLTVQSRTGSGKTGAFVLPILDRVDTRRPTCQALVLVPTRELAKQVANEATMLAGDSGVRVVPVYGGAAYGPQLQAFKKGAHLVVGTPGRVLDHLLRGSLTLDDIAILVLDEADRMLSMGFYPDMRRVKSYLPREHVSAYMFSATFPLHVLRLAKEFLENPRTLSLSKDHVHVTDVLHVYYRMPSAKKDRALVRILEVENPVAALIFCNTKRKVHYLAVVLQRFGWDADELSADLNQSQRERVLQRVRDGKLRVLVATDVAGRGIDIPELSHVIQYEPPEDPETYVHRAGRTGRAGASGRAITLVAADTTESMAMGPIARKFEIDLQERAVPNEEDVEAIVSQRITARLEAAYRSRGQLERERLQRLVPLARRLSEIDDESVLLAMVLDDWYQRATREPDEEPRKRERPSDKPKGQGGDSERPRRQRRGGRGRGSDRRPPNG